jgi:hypothetical protein
MLNKNGLFKRLADEKKKVRGGGGGGGMKSTPHYGTLFLSGNNKTKQKWFLLFNTCLLLFSKMK